MTGRSREGAWGGTCNEGKAMGERSREQRAEEASPVPNGPAWAAILSAGIGGLVFGITTDLSEASGRMSKFFNWYRPAGALSGVAISTVLIWAAAWAALAVRWRRRQVKNPRTLLVATCLLVIAAVVATFPPFYELL